MAVLRKEHDLQLLQPPQKCDYATVSSSHDCSTQSQLHDGTIVSKAATIYTWRSLALQRKHGIASMMCVASNVPQTQTKFCIIPASLPW